MSTREAIWYGDTNFLFMVLWYRVMGSTVYELKSLHVFSGVV